MFEKSIKCQKVDLAARTGAVVVIIQDSAYTTSVQTSNQIQISAMQISAAAVYVCCCSSLQFHCLKVLNAKPKVKLDGTPKCMTTWPYFSTHSMKVQENQ